MAPITGHILDHDTSRAAQRARHSPQPAERNGLNRVYARQKAALTRAIRSKDPDQVIRACHKAVNEWSRPPFDGAWPDNWSRWQRALDDVLRWPQRILLSDLVATNPPPIADGEH